MSIYTLSLANVYSLGSRVHESKIIRPAEVDDITNEERYEMQPFAVLVPDRKIENKEEFPPLGEEQNPEELVMKTCFAFVEVCADDSVLVAIEMNAAFYVHISRVFIMDAKPRNMLTPSYTNVNAIFAHGF
jgi:hypothetical protein